MRLGLLLFLALLTMPACASKHDFELSIYFYEPEAQRALREELTKADIPYKVDKKGVVWYRIEDQQEVALIQKKILNETLVNQFATSYASRSEEQLFTEALERSAISYRIKEQGSHRWVTWSPEDDAKVRKIEEEVSDLILKKRAEQRQRDRQAR